MVQELVGVGEIEPPGQEGQFAAVLGERVRLLVVHQLERVFDRAEERVRTDEAAILVGMNPGEVGQPHQSVERIDAADLR